MAIFKCKMCGGTIEFNQGDTVGICDSCGTKQTLPRLDDDKKANLYDRANHFRRNNDYDKAMGIYEQILNEDSTDAEVYWSLVLCRYGIEYVEDPATHKRVPTVNRAQFTSIFDDDNYKSALKYADTTQKTIYEEEAAAINEIQKGILAISQKEEPFDVFICYKETDNNGRRTQDSVLANDLYHQLTQEGFKVFFSRITLEDKLGTAYEPYIFAALNSAKVMVVIGTKPEYFNAVWVKNEWSRYLALIRNGAKKMLIPAYRDMDPYDLPEEFSHLQAQDMSKLGFMQDLIRGIKKIVGTEEPTQAVKETVVVSSGNANTQPLLKRAFMFLEDGNWKEADKYCERVLDLDPECAEAYLGKLMAELGVRKREELKDCEESIAESNNFAKAVRFGDETLKAELNGYAEQTYLGKLYDKAMKNFEKAKTQAEYELVAQAFTECLGYRDSAEKMSKSYEKAEECRKNKIYEDALRLLQNDSISVKEAAIEQLRSISGWKDADMRADVVQETVKNMKTKLETHKIATEQAKIKMKKILRIAIPIICICAVAIMSVVKVVIPNKHYDRALTLIDEGKYIEAYETLNALDGYKDSESKMLEIYMDYMKESFRDTEVGDTIKLGTYEQDNDESNGKESIEWIALDKKNGKMLLISKHVLDCEPYSVIAGGVTWSTCSLRAWLNENFYNSAFDEKESNLIENVKIKTQAINNNTDGGEDTEDKIFFLSINEVEKYFSSDEKRKGYPTAYAQGRCEGLSEDNCWWWLRTPGVYQSISACVSPDGFISTSDGYVELDVGVRPAMWVSLE